MRSTNMEPRHNRQCGAAALHATFDFRHPALPLARRYFFRECGVGRGKIALASLLAESLGRRASAAPAATNPLAPRLPHFAPRAKSVIHLFMAGGPSHLELFDYKPKLAEYE